jgi:hypothetical protein
MKEMECIVDFITHDPFVCIPRLCKEYTRPCVIAKRQNRRSKSNVIGKTKRVKRNQIIQTDSPHEHEQTPQESITYIHNPKRRLAVGVKKTTQSLLSKFFNSSHQQSITKKNDNVSQKGKGKDNKVKNNKSCINFDQDKFNKCNDEIKTRCAILVEGNKYETMYRIPFYTTKQGKRAFAEMKNMIPNIQHSMKLNSVGVSVGEFCLAFLLWSNPQRVSGDFEKDHWDPYSGLV